MFWTWLWGTLGLLLSTPLTVCLAVLGKYVPSLWFFATLLGEEAELEPDVRFYQRLVALDRDGAIEVVEAALKQRPRVEVFDQVLVPALSRAERDAARDELERVGAGVRLGGRRRGPRRAGGMPDFSLAVAGPVGQRRAPGPGRWWGSATAPVPLVGLAVQDTSDALVLRMLGQLLAPSGCTLEIITDTESPLQVAERVAESPPRARGRLAPAAGGLDVGPLPGPAAAGAPADLPIVVGRWGESRNAAGGGQRLIGIGASHVVFTLADARDRISAPPCPSRKPEAVASPLPG